MSKNSKTAEIMLFIVHSIYTGHYCNICESVFDEGCAAGSVIFGSFHIAASISGLVDKRRIFYNVERGLCRGKKQIE